LVQPPLADALAGWDVAAAGLPALPEGVLAWFCAQAAKRQMKRRLLTIRQLWIDFIFLNSFGSSDPWNCS
jgi:hypothetical protein